jgi:phage tail sheath gpL-like
MTINTSLPSTVRRPGQFHEFDLTSSANGLTPLDNRVLLVGVMGATGTAVADDFNEIFDELQADTLFEQGSELALMIRKALQEARALGFAPSIWASGLADPAGAAKTTTITIAAGTSNVSADIAFSVAGRRYLAGVTAGDDQDAVALAIKAALDADLANLPVTAAVVTNVVTLTVNYTGVNGNALKTTIDDVGLTGLTITPADAVAGTGAALIATALSNSLAKFFETVAIANNLAADVAVLDTHLDIAWGGDEKRWIFPVMANNGTLSTANTVSNTANDERIVNVTYEDSPEMNGNTAAAIAVHISARELANYNWDGQETTIAPPPDASVYTSTEIESALQAGSTPLRPNDQRTKTEIVRLITTKTLEGANPFERAKDLATMRGLVFTTRQLDAAFGIQFKAVNKSAQVIKRMRSVAYNTLKALETLGVTQNVDALFPQLLVESDGIVATRANVSTPESIIPNLHQIAFVHVLFVE